jgi:hypothetical protein
MALYLLTWGGTTRQGGASTEPAIEEWTNSLAFTGVTGMAVQAAVDTIAALINGWFTDAASKIADTERLEWAKFNEWDLVTGHQITDPTVEHLFSVPSAGGGGGSYYPVTTAYRVSLDNGTRDRQARGGFFAPRTTMTVQQNSRFTTAQVSAAMISAKALVNGVAGSLGNPLTPVIWSRVAHSTHAVTRIRVSDLPDNIARRKNQMKPAFQQAVIP